ncbi:hypothetical protein N7530_000653 [Penicillium desertorum]|uniref:Uncharacterized protein n=1 Tax=Penicillium desertorum TaxID=1303715 RepID=A0A9W9X8I1_9EURO|nr:hypothetical protein N7530_000653 [Penicillium desertorum]
MRWDVGAELLFSPSMLVGDVVEQGIRNVVTDHTGVYIWRIKLRRGLEVQKEKNIPTYRQTRYLPIVRHLYYVPWRIS